MTSLDSFGSRATLDVAGKSYTIYRLDALSQASKGNSDKLPWQEQTVPALGPDIGTFFDNVYAVVREGKPQHITPQSVRETMRVLAMIRKGTPFTGKPRTETQPAAT